MFFKSAAQKGREYSHWIDLTLNSHFEAVISEIYLTKIHCLSKSTFSGSTKRSNKVQKGPAAPKPICLVKQKEERVELRRQMLGFRNYPLLCWPNKSVLGPLDLCVPCWTFLFVSKTSVLTNIGFWRDRFQK